MTARDHTTPRSVADQTVLELGGRTSILARQRADHQRLDRLMRRARETAAEGGPAHAVALRAVARLVFTHAFAEEAVLFPAARRSLPEGDPLTLRIETDHQEVDELVTRLDSADPAAADHAELMHRAFAVLDHDVRTEGTSCCRGCSRYSDPAGFGCLAGSGSWCGESRRPVRTRWCPGARPGRRCRPCR
jgi:hypothetical protein